MIVKVHPSKLSGIVYAPASKSAMQRVCAAALISKGKTIVRNPGNSNDDKAALNVIQQLGAEVSSTEEYLTITSNGVFPVSNALHCGESGLGIRMFTPLAALSKTEITITGEGSLVNRPMDFFDRVLPALRVDVQSNNGKLPLTIKGPLLPKNIDVDGSLSSQFLTGLLMAFSASLQLHPFEAENEKVSIGVTDLKSKPYIDLTMQVLEEFNLPVPRNKNYELFTFDAKTSAVSTKQQVREVFIEGDWSGASFLLVAAAISGEVTVEGLLQSSAQADKKIIEALVSAGAEVSIGEHHITIEKHKLYSFEFDATDCPDLFPPLVALASSCSGVTKIKGLKRLKHKESDRGITLQQEFAKLSTNIELVDDEMLVHGKGKVVVNDHALNSHHDHRIAMACAVACLNADTAVEIANADAVKKSYPDFWDHMKQLKAGISLKSFTNNNTLEL